MSDSGRRIKTLLGTAASIFREENRFMCGGEKFIRILE
jgi:hypothetical protein